MIEDEVNLEFINNKGNFRKSYRMAIVFLIAFLTIAVLVDPVLSQSVITVPDDYPTIQAAINAADSGDIINIKRGIYTENIVVNKSITLSGYERDDTVIQSMSDPTVMIEADNVEISGLTMRSVSTDFYSSLTNLIFSNNNVEGTFSFFFVSNAVIYENTVGDDMAVYGSLDINITGNIFNDVYGLWHSSNSIIEENTGGTLFLLDSSQNIVSNNNATSIGIAGQETPTSNNIVSGNRVEEGTGITIANSSLNTVEDNIISHSSGFGIELEVASNNSIIRNDVQFNIGGIRLFESSNNTITENYVYNTNVANVIELIDSNDNTIFKNDFSMLGFYGVDLQGSHNNKIFHNNFVGCQASDDSADNLWDDGYPSGGNYWSDYTGVDEKNGPEQDQTGSDGIGDTSYVIGSNSRDWYPLMNTAVIPEFSSPLLMALVFMGMCLFIVIRKLKIKTKPKYGL